MNQHMNTRTAKLLVSISLGTFYLLVALGLGIGKPWLTTIGLSGWALPVVIRSFSHDISPLRRLALLAGSILWISVVVLWQAWRPQAILGVCGLCLFALIVLVGLGRGAAEVKKAVCALGYTWSAISKE